MSAALLQPVWLVAAETAAEEANIAKVTASLLEQSHFAAHRYDGDLSAKFLDRYLDSLDGTHSLFLESDVAEFGPYRSDLEQLTLKEGDISPAQKIFTRYLERLEQRATYVTNVLAREQFEFAGHDTYSLDRRHAPRPRDLAAAEQLWHQQLRYEYLQEKLSKKKPAEIVTTLTKRYERTLRMMKQYGGDQVFETYLNALAHVYDPHSDYLGRRQLEEFDIAMRLSLFGIGAQLQYDDGYCKIRELLPGGPALAGGLIKPGDRIVAVAQDGKEPVDIIEMPLADAVQLIRGPKGTKVTLTLIPADAADSSVRKTVTLVRDEIRLEKQEAQARIVDWPVRRGETLRLGVIDLPSFYVGEKTTDGGHTDATSDVIKLIKKLKAEGIQGLILDLRPNGGGSLDEAIRLSGLFIKSGPIVQTKDSDGDVSVSRDPDPSELYDGPMVVLTSRASASASEILAGALQDYGRAVIVGDTSTFGKGTVQNMILLGPLMRRFGLDGGDNPGALKLTIREFYRPGGSSTQLKGVASDIVLPSPLSVLKIGEGEMDDCLPWDKVAAAKYDKLDLVSPYLAELRARSARRVAHNEDFIWLREDIVRAKQRFDQPVMLNETLRRREIAQQEGREKVREHARAHRRPSEEVQYEITLQDVSQPGLPAPMNVVATNASVTVTNHPMDNLALADPFADDKDKDPTADITLEETKRILANYIELMERQSPVASR